jgi:type III restriction enzyme
MKLSFESDLQYQQETILSIIALFEGQPLEDSINEYSFKQQEGILNMINGIGNNLVLSDEQILDNLQAVQTENEIKQSADPDGNPILVDQHV